ncbi:site-specific DNA-methyltransferase [Mannheimia indoligenes]|uniref:site-specific DNA-methyltransferase n=1 Tax=Mannheimia indoligenes TaxID=3103145 RepID=UPI002FE6ACC0
MSALTELTNKLKEIFQIDRADLDFGIYRILNSRNEQIAHYLDHTLPQSVGEKLKENSDVQNAVYRHLLTFFGRYYEEGDFISQRRYKGDTYAIPYNGEEVLLHWANKDQYYTKSGENFANYRFKLSDGREVFFKLNQADTAKDNQKDKVERVFVLTKDQIIETKDEFGDIIVQSLSGVTESADGKVLTILFDYVPIKDAKQTQNKDKDNPEKDKSINGQTIFELSTNAIINQNWQILLEKDSAENSKERTLLRKYLDDYTQKNKADYFIHKDLGGFLKRELDFYIKNEVMKLDDIDNAQYFAHIEKDLRLIQTLRAIAFDIIAFLAQLENFQKRLWEKKKFVADCHYLITLDKIDEKFHAEIFANQQQIQEWQNLYGADNIKRENMHLVVNTALFNHAFQAKLLATFDDLDAQIGGTIIHSDNFQALNLLQAKYQGQVKCIYIDPPYNTNASPIIYKNEYKHSSWTSLMQDRIFLGLNLAQQSAIQFTAIDHAELFNLGKLQDGIFKEENRIAIIPIQHNPKGRNQAVFFSENCEYMLCYAKNITRAKFNQVAIDEEVLATFTEQDEKGRYRWENFIRARTSWSRKNKPNNWYPLYVNNDLSEITLENKPGYTELFPITASGDFAWKVIPESFIEQNKDEGYFKAINEDGKIVIYHKYYEQQVFKNFWSQKKYQSEFNGTNLLKNILGKSLFSFPKSIFAVSDSIKIVSEKHSLILDYFAGSGTTAHAVINLNREDGGNRKFILVEQGEYFNTVLKPRIQKVIFAKEYKDGKPVADKEGQFGGISQMVKVLKLESYEDTLNNLQLKARDLLDRLPENAQNDYVLNYMLDIESRESLLNVADFAKPFDYELNITTDSAGAFVRQKIDLVETFNYLIGAAVLGMTDRREKEGVVEIECQLPHQTNDDKTLIFWRDCEKVGYDDIKTMFEKRNINPKESQYQEIYINGDHTLDTVWENADGTQNTLKIKSIEQVFLDLMFREI